MIFFVDLDGVICDFVGGVCKIFDIDKNEVYKNWPSHIDDIASAANIKKGHMWSRIQATTNWWVDLDPLPWAEELISLLPKDNIWILSSPDTHHACYSGKIQWVQKHFPKLSRRVILTKDKFLLAGQDRVLIDDTEKKYNSFIDAGGKAILFPSYGNKLRKFADDPMLVVREELGKINL